MGILETSILGGIFVSDAIALGQFMMSRPIFCAPVVGLLLGDISTGLYIGMIMELVWITLVPLGNAVPPDSTVVAISATYLGTFLRDDRGYLAFLILCLVPAGILFKKLDIIHREFNAFFLHRLEGKLENSEICCVDGYTYLSLLFFILKGALFLLAVMWLGEKILPQIYISLPHGLRRGLENAFFIIPSVGLGTAITTFLFKKSQVKN